MIKTVVDDKWLVRTCKRDNPSSYGSTQIYFTHIYSRSGYEYIGITWPQLEYRGRTLHITEYDKYSTSEILSRVASAHLKVCKDLQTEDTAKYFINIGSK